MQRFDFNEVWGDDSFSLELNEDENGEFIRYADHESAMESLRAELAAERARVAELESAIKDPNRVRILMLRGEIAVPDDVAWMHDERGPVAGLKARVAELEAALRKIADSGCAYPMSCPGPDTDSVFMKCDACAARIAIGKDHGVLGAEATDPTESTAACRDCSHAQLDHIHEPIGTPMRFVNGMCAIKGCGCTGFEPATEARTDD